MEMVHGVPAYIFLVFLAQFVPTGDYNKGWLKFKIKICHGLRRWVVFALRACAGTLGTGPPPIFSVAMVSRSAMPDRHASPACVVVRATVGLRPAQPAPRVSSMWP